MTMYHAIVNAVKQEVVPYDDISIIKTGNAIQNARTSFVENPLNRDGYHLSYTMGRYVAGLTLVRALTGLGIDNVSITLAMSIHNIKRSPSNLQIMR